MSKAPAISLDNNPSSLCCSDHDMPFNDLEDETKAKCHMKLQWYDAHLAMRRKSKDNQQLVCDHLSSDNKKENCPVEQQKEENDIDQVMGSIEASVLSERLYNVQEQLCAHHELLDEMEEIKAQNKQLEQGIEDLLREDPRHKENILNDAHDHVFSLENEVVELRLELAKAKGREDHHNAMMRSIMNTKKNLEKEVEALRNEKIMEKNSSATIENGAVCSNSDSVHCAGRNSLIGSCHNFFSALSA